MRQKILQIVGSGEPGGGTTAVLTLSEMLHKHGEDVTVVSQHDSYLLTMAKGLGIRTRGMDFSSRGAAIWSCVEVAKLMKTEKPEVIHAHGGRAGLPVALAMRLSPQQTATKFVYTVHGFHFLAKKGVMFHLARLSEKLCLETADWTNFVSQGDQRIAEAQRLLPKTGNILVIPNAVSVDGRSSKADRSIDIVFVGRLTYQKNPLVIPDIIANMRPLSPTVHIIGGGELETQLKNKVADLGLTHQFTFHGQQDRATTLNIAAQSKILLLPSRWEGHPITVIEAMHLGIPVVASKISGTGEIVQHGHTGYLVPADDVAAYSAALSELLMDDRKAVAMGVHAQQEAKRCFSPEQMLESNMNVYRMMGMHPRFASTSKAS